MRNAKSEKSHNDAISLKSQSSPQNSTNQISWNTKSAVRIAGYTPYWNVAVANAKAANPKTKQLQNSGFAAPLLDLLRILKAFVREFRFTE